MANVNIKIEGQPYVVEEGLTVLEAARICGYEIPSLCAFNHGECSQGSCRVCLVEATGARGLVASCVYPIAEGMEITISSPKAAAARRASVELLLSNHSFKCQQCEKNENCDAAANISIIFNPKKVCWEFCYPEGNIFKRVAGTRALYLEFPNGKPTYVLKQ